MKGTKNDEHKSKLQGQIERLDILRETSADFTEVAEGLTPSASYSAAFEAELPDDGRLRAFANIDFDGTIEDVHLREYHELRRLIDLLEVQRENALWDAMELWLESMRNAPKESKLDVKPRHTRFRLGPRVSRY